MSGRIRTIKPELLEDAVTAGLSHLQFRLFVSSLLLADDYGNLRATPSLICGSAFWATKDAPADVEAAMGTLEEEGLIRTYELRGQLYAHVCGWSKHQRVDKPGKPRVPAENEPECRPARPWVTYVVRLGEDGPVKIGKAIDAAARVAKLQTGCPEKLHVIRVIGKNVEADLHRRFEQFRKHGEWFEPAPELVEFIEKEQFEKDSRMIRDPLAPDLRPPTSDLRPPSEVTPRDSHARLKSVPPPAPDQPPPPESVEPEEPAKPESGYDLARRVWDELWTAKYHEPYPYAPDVGHRSDDRVLQNLGHMAAAKQNPEAWLRHVLRAYLRDHGDRNWLDGKRHPLRTLLRDIASYGEPPTGKHRVAPVRPAEPVAPALSAAEVAAKLGSIGIGKIGMGGAR